MASSAPAWDTVDKWLTTISQAPGETVWRGINDYLPVDPNLENGQAQARFDAIAVVDETKGTKLLTERSLTSLLQDSGALPRSRLGDEAGLIIFQSLSYLSSIPFPPATAEIKSQGLTYQELERSLAWLLRGHLFGRVDSGRARTDSDERRHLFQSLATVLDGAKTPLDHDKAKLSAADDVKSEANSSPAFDEDGDQMFHDLLDVLHAVQPNEEPTYQPLPRDRFRVCARGLHDKNVRLHDLAIPRQRFKTLIQTLLPLQLSERVWIMDQAAPLKIEEFEQAAERVTAAFYHESELAISWRTFDHAWLTIAPQLFRIYYRVLCRLLLGDLICTMQSEPDQLERFPSPGKVLDRPLLCQVGTIFSHTFTFDEWECLHHYTPAEKSTVASVIQQFELIPSCAMMVLSGANTLGEKYVFAAFSSEPSKDGKAITRAGSPYWEGAALVQLAPVQDVFRGVVGQPGWKTSASDICFGNVNNGVAMVLKNGLGSAKVSHNVTADQSEVKYRTTDWRSNWIVEFEIDEIEIWGDPTPLPSD